MLNWKIPEKKDIPEMKKAVQQSNCCGSDASALNIYLLRNKYNTEICFCEGFLFRKYHGLNGRRGYGYPLGNGSIDAALGIIKRDSEERGEKTEFCLLEEKQKKVVNQYYNSQIEWDNDAGNSDYIYVRGNLAKLSGKNYHKKKNHVLKFCRTYSDWKYCDITEANIKDTIRIAEKWFDEKSNVCDRKKTGEYEAIKEAADNYFEFGLCGGILYVGDNPAAMTIGSEINKDVCDVHFEKAVGKYAADGAYAVINNMFALSHTGYIYLNREEDINIEGLRKAKMSYHPDIILKKFSGKILNQR